MICATHDAALIDEADAELPLARPAAMGLRTTLATAAAGEISSQAP